MIVLPDSPRDRALFSALPLILAPKSNPLPELEVGRTRLIIANDGLYIEARTNVLRARACLATVPGLPYGPVEMEIIPSAADEDLLLEAVALAAQNSPDEWAGLVVRGEGGRGLQLHLPLPISASPHRVSYSAAGVDPLDILWDIHSHGRGSAFFSGQDDADDLASPCPAFLAMVIGRAHSSSPTWATRLVIAGRVFDVDDPSAPRHLAFR